MRILDWETLSAQRAPCGAGAARAGSPRRHRRRSRARSSRTCARDGDAGAARLHRAFRRRGARDSRGRARRNSSQAAANADIGAALAALERAIDNVERFHRAQQPDRSHARDHAGRALRADHPADLGCRSVRACRLRAAALRRHHVGRAGAHRRLPAASAVHAARPRWQRQPRGAGRGRALRHRVPSSRSAARRPSPRWPTAPERPKVDKIFGPGNAWVTAAKQVGGGRPGRRGLRHARGPLRSAGDCRRQRARRVRRRGPAGAGRARPAGPGDPADAEPRSSPRPSPPRSQARRATLSRRAILEQVARSQPLHRGARISRRAMRGGE